MRDMHAGLDDASEGPARAMGERLAETHVADATVAAVKRGRRGRTARAGVLASVGAVTVGALVVGAWNMTPGPESVAPAESATTVADGTADSLGFYLGGPAANGLSPSLDLDALACGQDWKWTTGVYLATDTWPIYNYRSGAGGLARGDDLRHSSSADMWSDFPDGVKLDVTDPSLTYVSTFAAPDAAAYETVALLWVDHSGAIVGNVTGVVFDDGIGSEALDINDGRTSYSAILEQAVPLAGPGACEIGVPPSGLKDGAYGLHVIQQYGPAHTVRLDGKDVAVADPRYGVTIDVDYSPWFMAVTGLSD